MFAPASARGVGVRFVAVAGFVVVAALARLVPHPPNFAPVGAIALFGGAMFASRGLAFAVPLAAMLLSDVAIEFAGGTGFHALAPAIYACFALTTWLGTALHQRRRVVPIVVSSLIAATLFFVVTNFAVWLMGHLYPLTVAGLLQCYVAAFPFFGNTLLSQALYGAVLFGGSWVLERSSASVVQTVERGSDSFTA